MAKRLIILTLLCLVAMPAISMAMDKTGTWGLGFFHPRAPIGARYWFNGTTGFDLGVGFASAQEEDQSAGAAAGDLTSMFDYYIDVGLLKVVVPTANTNFMIRPGVLYSATQQWVGSDKEYATTINFTVHLTVEHFFSDRFSLSAGHGFGIRIANPAGDEDPAVASTKTTTSFAANEPNALSIVDIGFHFYLK